MLERRLGCDYYSFFFFFFCLCVICTTYTPGALRGQKTMLSSPGTGVRHLGDAMGVLGIKPESLKNSQSQLSSYHGQVQFLAPKSGRSQLQRI